MWPFFHLLRLGVVASWRRGAVLRCGVSCCALVCFVVIVDLIVMVKLEPDLS
jgi:hypothetical protein